jgi:hypothetical protein
MPTCVSVALVRAHAPCVRICVCYRRNGEQQPEELPEELCELKFHLRRQIKRTE